MVVYIKRFFLFLFLILISSFHFEAKAQTGPAPVHFVYGSDTSTPGINVVDKSTIYHNTGFELFSSPTGNASKMMDKSYRTQFKDSYGNPLKMTWWMQGGSLYRFAENTNIPFGSTMSLHLMQKYHGDMAEELGDEMSFHYHSWAWSDVNGDGRYYWNQAFSFEEVQEDFDVSLAEHFLEEQMFPVSFRSGWHYMDNLWQQHLNKWVPFSLHNNSPVHTNPVIEPIDNLIDWGHATTDFVPFRPGKEDYQAGGGSGGWNTRSRYLLRLNEEDVRQIFEQASQGISQVACVWGHLAESQFMNNMEQSLQLIYSIAEEYPDVPFHFSTAIEAMQDWLKTQDTTAPELDIKKTESGDTFHIEVTVNEPIFQASPFLAVKNMYEQHSIVPMEQVGDLSWKTSQPLKKSEVAKWGVAVTDTVGNLSKEFFNLLPDDIYVDNSGNGFSTQGGGWQTISFSTVDHIWGRDIQQAALSAQDSASAIWTARAPGDDPQQVFVRLPDVKNPVTEVTARLYIDGELITEKKLVNPSPNKWLFIDVISPVENQNIEVTLGAKNEETEDKIFAVDVVKFSPLIKKRQLHLPIGPYDFHEVVYDEAIEIAIPLVNRGSQPLTVDNISSSSGIVSASGPLPLSIPAHETRDITLSLFSDKARLVEDTLIFESNDPIRPLIKKGYKAEFRNYFRLVDNDDKAGYEESGSWFTSSTQAYAESSRYAFVQGSGSPSVTFSTSVEKTGFYDTAYIVPESTNSADRADYSVSINGTIISGLEINQNESSGNWASLGMHYLDAGDEIEIHVRPTDKNQPNKVLRADAFRVSLIGENIAEIILDNEDDSYSEKGSWNTSVAQVYGSSSRYVMYNTDASATFKYEVKYSSPHQISMIVPETENASNEAEYIILQNGKLRGTVILNQNEKSGDWRNLGSWSFEEGDTLSVRVSNVESNPSSRVLRADAIRLQYGVTHVVSNEPSSLPEQYSLKQNYPNPFNPSTTIGYSIPANTHVFLSIYNILGKRVTTLVDKRVSAGKHQIVFKANGLSSGVYYYQLTTNDISLTKAFTLIK